MMKITYKIILVACFVLGDVIPNVKENVVVTGEHVASIYENPSKRDGKCHAFLTPGPCLENDENCTCHSQCCSGVCNREGKCECTTKFSQCTTDRECCVGKCIPYKNIGQICYCSEIGESCNVKDNATCCEGYCDSKSTCHCAAKGEVCASNKECCKGICQKGTCVCKNERNACTQNHECCNGFCDDQGTCNSCHLTLDFECLADNAGCCRGLCVASGVIGVCLCGTEGNECTEDNFCCNGKCESKNGKKVCTCVSTTCVPGATPCCLGVCKEEPKGKFTCSGAPLYAECRGFYDCESFVCGDDHKCSCLTKGKECVAQVQCCPTLTCDLAHKPNVCV